MISLKPSPFVCDLFGFIGSDWFLSAVGGILGGIVFVFVQWQFYEKTFFRHSLRRNLALASIYIFLISPIISLVLNLNPVVSGLLSGMAGPIAFVSIIGSQLDESARKNAQRSRDIESD